MTYELAKQLKDAGFPQGKPNAKTLIPKPDDGPINEDIWSDMGGMRNPHIIYEIATAYYVPTLSELIAACGDRFHSLVKTETGWEAVEERVQAYFESGEFEEGKTPEEAVSRLWLKLHENAK